MTSAAVAEANFFQRYLIPEQSCWVRYCMHKAAEFSQRDNFIHSHFVSVSCAVVAVVLSLFKAISYVLQIPFRILLNVARFNPLRVMTDLIQDLTNVARSLLFVSLGVTLIISGLIFPAAIFSHFAPDSVRAGVERLSYENDLLRKEIQELKAKRDEDRKEINELCVILRRKQSQLDSTWTRLC